MGLGRAQNWYFNPVNQAWEVRGKAGTVRASIDEVGVYGVNARFTTGTLAIANIANLKVAGGGTISLIQKFTGTLPTVTVGTGQTGIATMTGVGSAGIAVGDMVFGNAKAALSDSGIAGFIVPTTNVVTARLTSGVFPNVGVDIVVVRTT